MQTDSIGAPARPRIGSLFSGYGGLDRAVEEFFGAETAWHCEFDAAPSKILAHHWPGVPNLGDITKVDWSQLEPVDIITGGSPCQDLSAAGRRGGMTEGTRSNLWVQMRECIAAIRPAVVVWENVRGAFSAAADCDLESCEGCVGDAGDGRTFLRALNRVLGDFSDLGYDTEWVGLRASDAGAPHARFRVFVVAYDRATANAGRLFGRTGWNAASGEAESGRSSADAGRSSGAHAADTVAIFPTPAVADALGGHASRSGARSDEPLLPGLVRLFPTPRATDGEKGGPNQRGSKGDLTMNSAVQLLPTPRATRGASNTETLYALGGVRDDEGDAQGNVTLEPAFATTSVAEYEALWDALDDQSPFWVTDKGVDYWPAINRWAGAMGRKSPSPTIPDGKGGKHRLNPKFTEWLMGQDDGWITNPVLGLTRNEQLKACGNGVVTQQAALALSIAWPRVLESNAANP